MMKLLVNQAFEQMGLRTTQLIGTLLDGSARHTPEGVEFTERGDRGRRPRAWPTATGPSATTGRSAASRYSTTKRSAIMAPLFGGR